jgi:NAD-dependent dihydropyrimidine dehydrogenase PreA subunit
MAGRKLTVVLSQSPGKVPAKRHLEEEIAAALLLEPNVDVSLIPHLYDLPADDTGLLFLRGVGGDILVLAWLYPRATRWVLDRQGIKGQIGVSLLDPKPDEDDDEVADEVPEPPKPESNGVAGLPNRRIYCLDLRNHAASGAVVEEAKRIAKELATQVVTIGGPLSGGAPLAGNPATNGNGSGAVPKIPMGLNLLAANPVAPAAAPAAASIAPSGNLVFDGRSTESPSRRRWYPVIDYSRCTNCMECIDFCLFGVYGVDAGERILVEQQDNCKKGCPACSRVCPENAIIFPEYKTAAIAGAETGGAAGIKIDLSKLFGGGDGEAALDMAVAERDRELVADGREAVGMAVGIPKRQSGRAERPRDELDDLVDGLDDLDL